MTALGVVDWGIGGIGLVQALEKAAPGLPVLYWSDTGALPYGRMRTGQLTARLSAVLDRLSEMGASEAVLACNAASTVVEHLGAVAIPVHGIIDCGVASVPDAAATVGVIGGRRTIAAGHYRRGLARPGRVVLSRVAQPLSAHIEAGRTGSAAFRADLARILAPLRGVEALVLACTHYPAARRWFSAALPDALLIDPAQRLAAAVAERHPQARGAPRPAERTFVTTGDPEAMRRAALAAWGVEVAAARVHRH
ncbi:glutamate racemase [Mycobacterium talmoniae]|uniref:Uncharacterized protein n=1 Tax=Mycobacterium talmoniae TaxID=1858794 RepID=A0A1S1NN88_9MYCO|nr:MULTISPECIES: aspartate/glutamate racemase family protein [Mycobacterium]OHV05735.1 hypothetical protein BKN37_04635 [Mycobacterium talmoniae]TDH56607.1 hypothetical protein E2F47_05595 [Mycobacterium eburneum]